MPWIVELCGEEDFRPRHAGGLDARADFGFVAVGKGAAGVSGGRGKGGGHTCRCDGSLRVGLPRRLFRLCRGAIATFQGLRGLEIGGWGEQGTDRGAGSLRPC